MGKKVTFSTHRALTIVTKCLESLSHCNIIRRTCLLGLKHVDKMKNLFSLSLSQNMTSQIFTNLENMFRMSFLLYKLEHDSEWRDFELWRLGEEPYIDWDHLLPVTSCSFLEFEHQQGHIHLANPNILSSILPRKSFELSYTSLLAVNLYISQSFSSLNRSYPLSQILWK